MSIPLCFNKSKNLFKVTEVKHTKTPDPTMMSLKNAVTPGDVMGLVQSNLPQMTDQHMLQALRSLFQLQKNRYVTSFG